MFIIPFLRLSVGTTSPADSGKVLYDYSMALLDEVMKKMMHLLKKMTVSGLHQYTPKLSFNRQRAFIPPSDIPTL